MISSDAVSDEQLLGAVAQGDRRAFEQAYHRFAPRVGSYLYRLLQRRELAEEALNDVMLVMWNNAASFDSRSRPCSWLVGIAHNTALKLMARERRAPTGEDVDDLPLTAPDNPEQALTRDDARRTLLEAIEALPVAQRAVMVLTFQLDRSCAEVAAIVGCPINTVKARMFQARKVLRRDSGVRSLNESRTGAMQ